MSIDITDFKKICNELQIWIIHYCSSNVGGSVYCIWGTDIDAEKTDKFLTVDSGNILAARSIKALMAHITSKESLAHQFEKLDEWIARSKVVDQDEDYTYDIDALATSIIEGNLNFQALDNIVGFINLIGDFAYQDKANAYLKDLTDNESIRKVWNYFYDHIFWPQWNSKGTVWKIPPLQIYLSEFAEAFELVRQEFDARIEVVA